MPEQYQRASSFTAIAIRSRSIINSFRHNQVVSMDQIQEDELEELDHFQSYVTNQLSAIAKEPVVSSVQLLHKLLDSFLNIQEEFRTLLASNAGLFASRSSSEKTFLNFLDNSIKSLDICNELTQSIQSTRNWNKNASIASVAVKNSQHSRARRALFKLKNEFPLPAVTTNLSMPRGVTSIGGAEAAVYTMSYVMVFVMNVVVGVVSGGWGEGSNLGGGNSRQMGWGLPVFGVLEKKWKEVGSVRKEVEKYGRELMECEEVCKAVEVEEASMRLEEELDVLERRVKELFRRIVRCREDVLRSLETGED